MRAPVPSHTVAFIAWGYVGWLQGKVDVLQSQVDALQSKLKMQTVQLPHAAGTVPYGFAENQL